MEYFFALSFFVILFFVATLLFLYLPRIISEKANIRITKNAQRESKQNENKDKLLNAISVIHSTDNSNALNGALKDFYQSIRYYETHKINFLDKDLGKLNNSIEKFAKHKAFKLYGLNLQKEASREYIMNLKMNSL